MRGTANSITTNITPSKIKSYRALAATDPSVQSFLVEMCDLLDAVNDGQAVSPLSDGELESLNARLDSIQQDVANRNGEKLAAWRQEVRDRLFDEMFPGQNQDDLLTRRRKMHYAVKNSINILGFRSQPVIDAVIDSMFPGKTEADVQEMESKLVEWDNKSKVLCAAEDGRPLLESTQLRDAAFQLYHFVKAVCSELNK